MAVLQGNGQLDEHTNFSLSSKYICFSNYKTEQMLEIFKKFCNDAQFILSSEAEQKAQEYFSKNEGNTEFGNARGVRNYFDKVSMKQASRIVTTGSHSDSDFRTLIADDMMI